jgi:hypothetical protein
MPEEYLSWKKLIGRTKPFAGIFAIAEVQSYPKHWPPEGWNDERFQKYRIGDPWNNEYKKDVYYIDSLYTKNLVRNPLVQEIIWDKLNENTKTDLVWFKNMRRRLRISVKSATCSV